MSAYPVSSVRVPANTCVVEAAITQGHQKVALAHLGEPGGSWCLASDEGAYLRGTNTAPAPLMHWAAGVHADLVARSRARGPVAIEFDYAVSGSFAQGGARGEAFAPRIEGEVPRDAASPLLEPMRLPLRNTFALYVNGRRRPMIGAHAERARVRLGGRAFCYLTQLSRYIEARKLVVSGARLVQTGLLAGPVDAHLFLNGAAPDAAMQELLAMGARTCFLHATLGVALSPTFD